MPARRRNKTPNNVFAPRPVEGSASAAAMSDVERFAAALKVTEAKKAAEELVRQAEREAEAERKAELQRLADQAAAHEASLKRARADKARAVDRLKDARWAGRGVPEAEAAWRDATAAVVELETGQRAAWDRRPQVQPDALADEQDSDSPSEGDGSADEADATNEPGEANASEVDPSQA